MVLNEAGHGENEQEQLSCADIQLPDETAWQILLDLEQTKLVLTLKLEELLMISEMRLLITRSGIVPFSDGRFWRDLR